ncbi:DNA-binding protein [Tropicimonas isoalkanivorans]|nr:DNA-binding protein [Tropicimonas isoalkanivorans]
MNRKPPLDPWRFDAITSGPERLWGLSPIASALGVSVDTARKLAKRDDVPIYQPPGSGRYFATRTELNEWMRTK